MRAFSAGARIQLAIVRAQPDYWLTFVVSPLMGILFLSIVSHAGRDDLLGAAVLAPVLFGLVSISLNISGETIVNDRSGGILESTIVAPSALLLSVAGRVSAVTALAGLGFAQSWLVAWAAFGVAVPIYQPVVFGTAAILTLFAMMAAALLMASVFVVTRSAQVLQLSLAFPLLLLGGVLVPVATLPSAIQPFARLVFLSWSSDLLRDSLEPGPVEHVPARLGVVAGLGTAMLGLASWAINRTVDRLRRRGAVTYL